MRWLAAFPIALAGGLSLAASAGAAAPTIVALEYRVAPDAAGCPDAGEFRASVERQLGYDPFRPTADRRVAVDVAPTAAGYDGRIRWSDADGRGVGDRQLSSHRPDCAEIAASLAFSVAVQIQLIATLAPASPEPAAPPQAEPSPASTKAPDQAAVASEPRRPLAPAARASSPGSRLELALGLGPSLALGVAPSTTGLGRAFVRGRIAWFSLEAGGDAALPAKAEETDGSGFSLRRYSAGAAACAHVRAFAGCLTSSVGVLEARGFGLDAPASPSGVFSQAGARVLVTRELEGSYFVAAHADGLVMLSPWTVTLNDTAVWTTPRLSTLLGIDFGAKLF